ncbi:unnamed protein product [Gongylonema pulchrum]|uniref:Metalloendopeptidase n=1 Tax=Gongylonema pulchrum TaxID=637853 RepID=A0A183D055_9BILA|nr:unnamed protein product [Gongylonema pulchrum]
MPSFLSFALETTQERHSLGLFHEQARYDRDQYVNIRTENIIAGYENQFSKRAPDVMETFAVPYDYGSLMHFNQTHFSRNGHNTIDTKDANYRYTIGQRTQLTFSDAKKINLAYCKDVCKNELKCENNGYTDPKNCSRCRCPEAFGGNFCEHPRKTSSAVCGTNLDLTCSDKKQKIDLSGAEECHYVIRVTSRLMFDP